MSLLSWRGGIWHKICQCTTMELSSSIHLYFVGIAMLHWKQQGHRQSLVCGMSHQALMAEEVDNKVVFLEDLLLLFWSCWFLERLNTYTIDLTFGNRLKFSIDFFFHVNQIFFCYHTTIHQRSSLCTDHYIIMTEATKK